MKKALNRILRVLQHAARIANIWKPFRVFCKDGARDGVFWDFDSAVEYAAEYHAETGGWAAITCAKWFAWDADRGFACTWSCTGVRYGEVPSGGLL